MGSLESKDEFENATNARIKEYDSCIRGTYQFNKTLIQNYCESCYLAGRITA
jgi:hypothetical protein